MMDQKRILVTPVKQQDGINFYVRRSEDAPAAGDTTMFLGNEHILLLDDETFLLVQYCPRSFLKRQTNDEGTGTS